MIIMVKPGSIPGGEFFLLCLLMKNRFLKDGTLFDFWFEVRTVHQGEYFLTASHLNRQLRLKGQHPLAKRCGQQNKPGNHLTG